MRQDGIPLIWISIISNMQSQGLSVDKDHDGTAYQTNIVGSPEDFARSSKTWTGIDELWR